MIWGALAGVSLIPVLLVLYEWPSMKESRKKEKAAFLALTFSGWLLAMILVIFPDLPGPTQMIDMLFKPVFSFWEKLSGHGKS